MCRLRNIALESVTDGQTDDGKSDPNVSLCFAVDTKMIFRYKTVGEQYLPKLTVLSRSAIIV